MGKFEILKGISLMAYFGLIPQTVPTSRWGGEPTRGVASIFWLDDYFMGPRHLIVATSFVGMALFIVLPFVLDLGLMNGMASDVDPLVMN